MSALRRARGHVNAAYVDGAVLRVRKLFEAMERLAHRRDPVPDGWPRTHQRMTLIVGVLVILACVVILPRVRMSRRANASRHGYMTERWMAEQRASHLS